MRRVFKTALKRCPECNKRLRPYRSHERTIKSIQFGTFTAVHRIMTCRKCKKLFRSAALDQMIEPDCTYANDIMLESAMLRFIHGRSCSEISRQLGISERQARNLSNMALDGICSIHEENASKLKEFISSYVLQIDGTTDSDFAMIVVVRDAISGFTLYSEKCFSESQANITGILKRINERFGIPSGAISDMRTGILSAIADVFPNIPVRICLLHFLRDLGKDMMHNLHTDLGIRINRIGIKSKIKAILRSIPEYDHNTLIELRNRFCSNPESMEIMSIRRILERVLAINGSSGYGFPFSLKHLNFYLACSEALKDSRELAGIAKGKESSEILNQMICLFNRVVDNKKICQITSSLKVINDLFQSFRKLFHIPKKGKLSDAMDNQNPEIRIKMDKDIQESCKIFMDQLNTIITGNKDPIQIRASKMMMHAFNKWEKHLFAQNPEGTIPRTNNAIEQFFRKIRRNVRKRSGNIATGRYLALNGNKIAIFQNIAIPKYVETIFPSGNIASAIGKYRKSKSRNEIPRKMVLELIDKGKKELIAGTLKTIPYSEELMEQAYAQRGVS